MSRRATLNEQFGAVADTIRIEGTRILATLIRTVGDVQLAEDAVQEAVLAALGAWPVTGVPPEPRAWLTVTARRKAIDIIRREGARADKERAGAELQDLTRHDLDALDPDGALDPDEVVQDDLLRLIFTCCHPSLSPPTRVALALRTLCGLSPAQIADVLLTTEVATTKRLVRARQKIAAARIPYRVPPETELPDRLPAVCAVIHSLYTAGHAPAEGEAAYDVDVCAEAIRLAELLHTLLPDQPTPTAVLALLLLTEARRPARIDDAGDVVTLDLQDRSRWDQSLITRGVTLLNESLERSDRQADAYQLQAAIAAEHARVPSYTATDWREIVRLYDLLVEVSPSPASELARVVAIAEAGQVNAALDLLDAIPTSSRSHAIRAELLARQHRYAEAIAALDQALDTAPSTHPERSHRERRRSHFQQLATPEHHPNPTT
ncbi:RNA polymerase sigma-70 factor (ECF subfamily) [Kribbella rubisoli]|uniref:RNA polymerase sigma-70 factor (ECF subfamily) n=1 Tax=Kribbella rubisoli TaxID=3075929 RepID=A0A4Q7W2L2_9ACTN|nr:RNA polymerase sigma-70 factor (ECF subfamily) [Kribbella rubisoli]